MVYVSSRTALPPPQLTRPALFGAVLDERRSAHPARPLLTCDLSTLLWYAVRVRHSGHDELKRPWFSRSSPGAGGVCEVDVVVDDGASEPWLYDARHHQAVHLDRIDFEALTQARSRLRSWLPDAHANATTFYCVADVAAISARYEFSETLIWRDAGALIAVIALVSEWIGVVCCPLGLTGAEMTMALSASMPAHQAAGVVILGRHA